MSLYAAFDTAVNRAWSAAAQEMFLSLIILFRIEFFVFQEKRLLKYLSFLSYNIASAILGSHEGKSIFDSVYHLFFDERLSARALSIFFRKEIKCRFRDHPLDMGSSPLSNEYT